MFYYHSTDPVRLQWQDGIFFVNFLSSSVTLVKFSKIPSFPA